MSDQKICDADIFQSYIYVEFTNYDTDDDLQYIEEEDIDYVCDLAEYWADF